jgi:uncharacterized protein (TIGR03437 family)
MRRFTWLILFALMICGSIIAQPRISVKIGSNLPFPTPNGPQFFVDGTSYISTQVFEWVQGTSHVVQFPLSLDPNLNATTYQSWAQDNIRYSFIGWAANTPLFHSSSDPVVVVTADPALTTLTANVTVQYKLHVVFPTSPNTGSSSCNAAPPGTVLSGFGGMPAGVIYVDQACLWDSADSFVSAGAHTLSAVAYPGWVFYGWLINNQVTSLQTLNVVGPTTVIPQFSIAKRLDLITNPPGLKVLFDGSPLNTPPAGTAASTGGTCAPDVSRLPVGAPPGFQPLCYGQFDLLPGSKHTIGVPVPQQDVAGNYWIFSGWSNGMGQNATYTADSNTAVPDIVTANFLPGVRVSIISNPASMKLLVDGRDNWLAYNFVWGQGETHHISAETPQRDSHNRMYQFLGWSDKGAITHDVTVPTGTDFSVTANYNVLPQVRISSSPAGLNVNVDGVACPTPCVVDRAAGSQMQVSASPSIPASPGSRFDFNGWSDGGGAPARTVGFNQDTLALTVNYQPSFQLTTVTNPPKAGTFKADPASPDGFYPSGTPVSVSAVANGGFKFAHWEGDLAGTFNGGTLSMSSPHAVMADFATVPFIPPAGIQSVTGPTPDGAIAPGSIIAIYGENLAPEFKLGGNNPLSQAIGGTTLTVGDFLLPLVFVSPGQISAQVPWELGEGTYTLAIHNSGLPDVNGTFTVARDAPGIFLQANDQNLPLVLALHADGTLVNQASPAIRGEQIAIYGTGFGPYTRTSIDGFPPAPASDFRVADPVTVTVGSAQTTPDWAGAAAGMVGVSIVKVTINDDMAISGNATLTVGVNGKQSASMILPVQ